MPPLMVDTFGDNLLSMQKMPGDSYKNKHDKVKIVLNRLYLTSNIKAECEVFDAFRDLIPAQALEREGSTRTPS